MRQRGFVWWVVGLSVLGIIAISGVVWAQSSPGRADCPGQITCPLTGEPVCRDQCPTVDQARPDCPGRVVCPLTGKPVCKDRCPLLTKATDKDQAAAGPSCCAAGK